MMTSETPWQRRVTAAADTVAILMGYCYFLREKPAYAVIAVAAACLSVLSRLLYRLASDQKQRQPHGATR